MNHPELSNLNARLYHTKRVQEAEAYRQAKQVSGKNQTLWNTLLLKFFPPKTQVRKARADQVTLVESTN